VVIFQHSPRRDDCAQIDCQIVAFAQRVECHVGGQSHPHFTPHTGAQGMLDQLGGRHGPDGGSFFGRCQYQLADGFLRVGVGQGVEPEFFRCALPPGMNAGFAATVGAGDSSQSRIFCHCGKNLGRQGGHRQKGAGSPTDAALLNGKTAQDGCLVACAVGVFQGIVGDVIAQFVAVHVTVGKPIQVVGGSVLHRVQKDQPGGVGVVERNGCLESIQPNHILWHILLRQRKGNAAECLAACQRAVACGRLLGAGEQFPIPVVGVGQIDRGEVGRNRLHRSSSAGLWPGNQTWIGTKTGEAQRGKREDVLFDGEALALARQCTAEQ
jgi:hypothetical protein